MTLYEKLLAAGLPVLSATESGSVIWNPNIPMTPAQIRQAEDIILQHIDPAEYATVTAIRADMQAVVAGYQNMIDRLEQIRAAANPTNAQVIQAVRDEALYIERLLKYHAQEVRTGGAIPAPPR